MRQKEEKMRTRKPLSGMKILELAESASGSICTLFLSDYGAEIIKIESPHLINTVLTDEDKCARAAYDRGKASAVIDMDDDRARARFWELCKNADAVVEDLMPGTMKEWGITYETLKAVNPSVVYTSVTGYGQEGPYAKRRTADAVIQAESGLMSITGPRGKDSVRCGADISFYMAAMTGCIGTLIGLISAQQTGCGRRVDVSALDTSILCLENQLAVYMKNSIVPKPMGNSYDLFAPVGVYNSRDKKEFMLSVGTDRQWVVLCKALEKTEWISDLRYITNMRRVEHVDELDRELRQEFEQYSREELAQKFVTSHCVYGSINDFQAVEEHPQLAYRGMILRAVYEDGTSYRVPGSPIRMSGMERQMEYPVSLPGTWDKADSPIRMPEGAEAGTSENLAETLSDEPKRTAEKDVVYSSAGKSGEMPLEGIRILDFSQFLSGPLCTLMLSDFGAEVIKIENPPLGDNTRYGPYIEQEVSSHYAMRNRGKKSIVLNMKNEDHKKLFLKMVKTADAVVDNYKPGTMEKFGITYELLQEMNPRIVYTSISGYGQEGPYASHAAFDQPVQAESGVMSITGEAGGMPVKCGASIGDVTGGLAACIGTLMGILEARRSGTGRRIDVSMMDSLVFGLGSRFSSYLRTGIVPGPCGNRSVHAAPSGAYRCQDGERIMIVVETDEQWMDFCRALGRDDWSQNEKWASLELRLADAGNLDREIGREFASHTAEELEKRLEQRHCIFGRVNDFSAVVKHPQTEFRHTFVDAKFPNGVVFRVPGNPIRISGMKHRTEYPAAPLGYHTYEVLSQAADIQEIHRLFDPVLDEVRKAEKSIYDNS